MTARAQAQCTPSCMRYRSPFSTENTAGLTKPFCAAFPDGIPDDIWENRFDHRNPHEGDHGLRWESDGGLEFPVYALAVTEDAASTLTAAADVLNGAMIALVPSATDILRLAVQGGEPPEQMHLTLLFLGDNADLEDMDRERLLSWAATFAAGWDAIGAEAFAPALFNPTGPEPCAAMVCSGADLAEFYETVLADVSELVDLPPDLHAPWIPHVTLAYLTTGQQFADGEWATRVGPVTFDRLRLAFGGDVTDFALGSGEPAAVVPDEVGAEPVAAVAGAHVREAWDGPLR
jgi:2'-5' RNA ligase